MAIQVLPTRTDTPRYRFTIELDGQSFIFTFEWNDRDSGWYLSISDVNEVPLVSGVRVVLNVPLLDRYLDPRLPAGRFAAIDTSGTDTEAGFADLGDRVKLVYQPAADA